MSDLTKALADIGTPFAYGPVATASPAVQGPNNWESVTAEDFGPEHDFEVDDHGSIVILTPVSEAALQWCYYHLPEDAPRWGGRSYVVEPRYILDIHRAMQRDGLKSQEDYEQAMQEIELQNAQRESEI